MTEPPPTGNPFDYVPAGAPNRNAQGVLIGWEAVRFFWGQAAQEAWYDLQHIQGGILV
jgi:hypothetical protein